MPRASVGSTVERIRRQLASAFRYEVSMLGALLTSGSTTVQFTALVDMPKGLREGAVLSIDNEVLRVLGVDVAARTATVLRGWQDSTAAAHNNGSEVWINPRFTAMDIFDTMIAELQSWGPDLYRLLTEEVTVVDGTQTLALPVGFLGAYDVLAVNTHRTQSASDLWPYTTTTWPSTDFRLVRGPSNFSAAPASGLLLRFTGGLGRIPAGTVLVQASVPFAVSALTLADDLVTDCGLAESMLDVLDMGVKVRLLADQENQRSARVAQDTPRMAEETPPLAAAETAQRLFATYMRRKTEEQNKLRSLYGWARN